MIDLLLLDTNPFGYPAYMASKIHTLLEKEGIVSSIRDLSEGGVQEYLPHASPSRFITFEERLTEQLPLPQLLKCPELCFTKNPFTPIAHFFNDSERKVALADRNLARFAEGEFFVLPLEEPFYPSEFPRSLPIVSFIDLVDPQYIESAWKRIFSSEIVEKLHYYATLLKQSKNLHPLETLFSLEEKELGLYDTLIHYILACRSQTFIEKFTLPLHLFGDHIGQDWYLRLKKNVHLHRLPPFVPTLELFKEIEIFVIDQLEAIDGPSEYFFHALQRGALPLIPPSLFLVEIYGKNSPIFYHSHDELLAKCQEFIAHPLQRVQFVEELRTKSLRKQLSTSVVSFADDNRFA